MTHLDVLKFLAKIQANYLVEQATEDDDGDYEVDPEQADFYVRLLKEIREIIVVGMRFDLAALNSEKVVDEEVDEAELEEKVNKKVDRLAQEAVDRHIASRASVLNPPTYKPGGERKPPWRRDE